MIMQTVEFQYITGIKRPIFRNARLLGSWDYNGWYSETWTEYPMQETLGTDGCPIFVSSIQLEISEHPRTFKWGVVLDGPQGVSFWGIPTETPDLNTADRYRQFQLNTENGLGPQIERYYFTYGRRLGANKYFPQPHAEPGLFFSVWAPHAQSVEVVFGQVSKGYIGNDGHGINPKKPIIKLSKIAGSAWDGMWQSGPVKNFTAFKGLPYMYRLVNAQGQLTYRTDIFSRSQIGKGAIDPEKEPWPGTVATLDGTVSCSVVIDPDAVRRNFPSTPRNKRPDLIPAEEFWATEFSSGRPVPARVEDLVIYELHVGSLGFGKTGPGDLQDALNFLNHLNELGVNAVELLPMAEFSGNVAWGYGDTHHFCIESSAGGRDKYRFFVRECHRRGIAVIQDVVYNHYDFNAKRAQWQYDSTAPEQNIFYWYEGQASDYAAPDGGYLDNGSSGNTPRFYEEIVRQQFISSAVFLIEEMHVDGLRVDLTQAIHRDNTLHGDGRSIGSANIFGQKFLREWSRTLHMVKPSIMLIAEDHTGWDAVTKAPAQGGLGFDARWEASFYHNLIGDADMAGGKARLLKQSGLHENEPLSMDQFSGALYESHNNRVVFHESHDEAGNSSGTARTMVTAVNGYPLLGATRIAAESRCRLCCGVALLSAGTPMFLMGEEIAAQQPYTYGNFLTNREDILGERAGNGKTLFTFYQNLISLRRRLPSIRSHNIDILHQHNTNRVIVFKRWNAAEEVIIAASLNNTPFAHGYLIEKDLPAIPNAGWKEIFNSDAAIYGGRNVGNCSAIIFSTQGRINVVIPANGFVVLVKQ